MKAASATNVAWQRWHRCCNKLTLMVTLYYNRGVLVVLAALTVAQSCCSVKPQARVACKFWQPDNECGMLMMQCTKLQVFIHFFANSFGCFVYTCFCRLLFSHGQAQADSLCRKFFNNGSYEWIENIKWKVNRSVEKCKNRVVGRSGRWIEIFWNILRTEENTYFVK